MADPTVRDSDAIEKRVYIGGLHESINDQLLRERFARYGTVKDATIAKDSEGHCRGFGHLTILTTSKDWRQCVSVYNGAKWKGAAMRIEEAKPDYAERKRKEDETEQRKLERRQKKRLRWERHFAASDNMPLVTEKDVEKRKGWRRGKYGRAIAIMHLRRPDGTQIVFDPSHYKNTLTKLYNIQARMKSVQELPMTYEDFKHEQHPDGGRRDSVDLDLKNKSEEKRLAAMDRRLEEERQKHELISRALNMEENRSNHIAFDVSDDEGEAAEEPKVTRISEARPTPKDSSWMFDSDDDEGELEIKINPVLEGDKGRERLALQSTFKGDDRFKLDEAFIDEDEKADGNKASDDEDDISKSLHAEKNQAMDLLRAMFGEETVTKTKPHDAQWNTAAHYDPDAEDADKYLRKTEDTHEKENSTSSEEETDDYIPNRSVPVTAMPTVSTDKHFEVNTNLKPLFASEEAGSFKLFGGDDDNDHEQQTPLFGNIFESDEEEEAHTTKSKKQAQIGLNVMFFFHTDNPSLMKKSCFNYDPNGTFQRSTEEDYEANWQEIKSRMGEMLKRREKKALRRFKKQYVKDTSLT
ncbi:hypothetical protein BX666DRAFT_1884475 [Dichotomocladium elegans]|nr:hypothetical protein BX666DRAFT_1884475 [Dichotomocladium elegans]